MPVEVRSPTLSSLARVPVDVEVVGGRPAGLRYGASFSLAVLLTNRGGRTISWSPDHPLHLAYRWLDPAGKVLERDGLRTLLPHALEPDRSVEVQLAGSTPDAGGDYRLLVSLVLEGRHWACDVGAAGWVEVPVEVGQGPAWPAELRNSVGARALRGALAAADLKRELAGRTFEVLPPPPEPEPVPAAPPLPLPEPQAVVATGRAKQSLPSRFRNWLRKSFGVRNLQNDLQAVANAVTRQEQRSTDLQAHLHAVEQHMHAYFARSEAQVQNLLGELAAGRSHLTKQIKAVRSLRSSEVRLLGRLERLSKEIAAAAFEPTALAGLEAELERIQKSQQMLAAEVREGSVVSEIISTLRDLTVLVQASDSTPLTREVQSTLRDLTVLVQASDSTPLTREVDQRLSDVRRYLEEESRNRASDRDSIVLRTTQNAVKLDALLTRQVVPLPSAGLVLVRNRFGLLAIQDDDASAIAYYSTGDVPEAGTVALVERLLRPGDSFLDVGANVGIYSLIAARRVGPGGRVIAVEPVPSSARALRTTLAINGVSSIVEAHECALGSADGKATIHLGPTSGHSSLLGPLTDGAESCEVAVRRGEQLLGGLAPTLIKIDVEGWELEVLDGLRDFLSEHPDSAVLLELSPVHVRSTGLQPSQWLDRVRAFGWECWRIDDQELKLRPLTSADEVDDRGANLLFSHTLPRPLEPMLA